MAEGKYDLARSYFQQSQTAEPAIGTLLNLAFCEDKLGQLGGALAHLGEALAAAEATDKRRPLISQRIAEVEARMPRVTIRTEKPLEPGVTVSLDAETLDAASLGKPVRIDPGAHALNCAGSRGERCARMFTIAEGEHSVQVLTVELPAVLQPVPSSSASPAPTGAAGSDGRPSWAYVVGGAGVASVVVGLVAGAAVLHEKSVFDKHCDATTCDSDGLSAIETGRTLSAVSTVTTLVGASAMGVSAFFLLRAPSSKGTGVAWSLAGSF
jgi:hypothetical protein